MRLQFPGGKGFPAGGFQVTGMADTRQDAMDQLTQILARAAPGGHRQKIVAAGPELQPV